MARTTTYIEVEKDKVTGDAEAVIFLNGNVWHYRMTFDAGKSYHRGTTKCRDQDAAVRATRELFLREPGPDQSRPTPSRKSFGGLCDELLALHQRVFAAGQVKQGMMTLYIREHKVLKAWFGHHQPVKITSELWDEFVRHRLETGKAKRRDLDPNRRIGLTTLDHERLVMKQVLELAAAKKLIPVVPKLRVPASVKKQVATRGTFSDAELARIIQAIQREVQAARPLRTLLERLGLRTDGFNRVRTCYSIRHSYAMARVTAPGTNFKLLAENIGTSVTMLERHYVSHVSVAAHLDLLSHDPAEASPRLLDQ